MTVIERMIRDLAIEVRASEGDRRRLTFRGTTETVARDGGILRADGMDAAAYDKNPVVLWHHGSSVANDIPVIGRVVGRTLDKKAKAWDFDIEFPEEGVSSLADSVYRMAQAGFIRAASVGFRVAEYAQPTEGEREASGVSWIGKRWELQELSIVPVGSDPEALARSLKAGSIREADIEAMSAPATRAESPVKIDPTPAPALDLAPLVRELGLLRGELAELRDSNQGLALQVDGLRAELRDADIDHEENNRPEPTRGGEPETVRGKSDEDPQDEAALERIEAILAGLRSKKEASHHE